MNTGPGPGTPPSPTNPAPNSSRTSRRPQTRSGQHASPLLPPPISAQTNSLPGAAASASASNDASSPPSSARAQGAAAAALQGASLAFMKQQKTGSGGRQGSAGVYNTHIGSGSSNAARYDGGRTTQSSRPLAAAAETEARVAATSASSRSRSPVHMTTGTGGNGSQHGRVAGGGGGGGGGSIGLVSRQGTGGSMQDYHHQQLQQHMLLTLPTGSRSLSASHTGSARDPRSSPSFIAATLAASRSASPSPRVPLSPSPGPPAVTRRQRGGSPSPAMGGSMVNSGGGGGRAKHMSTASVDRLPDTKSLAPARSLISMFEAASDDMDPVKKSSGSSPPRRQAAPGPTRETSRIGETVPKSPKIRAASILVGTERTATGVKGEQTEQMRENTRRPKPKPRVGPKPELDAAKPATVRPETPPPPPQIIKQANAKIVSPKPRRISGPPKLLPPTPPKARKVDRGNLTLRSLDGTEKEALSSYGQSSAEELAPPKPVVTSSSNDERLKTSASSHSSASSDDSFVSASSNQSPRAGPPPAVERATVSPGPLRRRSVPTLAPNLSARRSGHASPGSMVSTTSAPRPFTNSPAHDPLSRVPSPGRRTTMMAPGRVVRHSTGPGAVQLPLDALTSAMVAGSLASWRHPASLGAASTPKTPPPVPAPRRPLSKHHRHHLPNPLHPHHTGPSGYLLPRRGSLSPRHRPAGVLLQTLRRPSNNSDGEEDRHGRHRHYDDATSRRGEGRSKSRPRRPPGASSASSALTSKRHFHHEGSRRRWREEITARERRRYEAVWASNRGLLLLSDEGAKRDRERERGDDDAAERVADLVVRDIWNRSRLPADELAEVWDLVAGREPRAAGGPSGGGGGGSGRPAPPISTLSGGGTSGSGSSGNRNAVSIVTTSAAAAGGQQQQQPRSLSRREFVVGMWLVDQRLRGRKIPPRVSESVWDSVVGVKVRGPKGK